MAFHFFSPSTQLPVLPIQSPAEVRHRALSSSVPPRPPHRPRPASAGAKRSSLGANVPKCSGFSHRPGSFSAQLYLNFPFHYLNLVSVRVALQKKQQPLSRIMKEVIVSIMFFIDTGRWGSSINRGLIFRNVSMSQSSQSMQDLLQDKVGTTPVFSDLISV